MPRVQRMSTKKAPKKTPINLGKETVSTVNFSSKQGLRLKYTPEETVYFDLLSG